MHSTSIFNSNNLITIFFLVFLLPLCWHFLSSPWSYLFYSSYIFPSMHSICFSSIFNSLHVLWVNPFVCSLPCSFILSAIFTLFSCYQIPLLQMLLLFSCIILLSFYLFLYFCYFLSMDTYRSLVFITYYRPPPFLSKSKFPPF